MEYNESASPSSPEGDPTQDNVSADRSGTDRSATDRSSTETTPIETSGTETPGTRTTGTARARTGTPGAEPVGVGTASAAEVKAPTRPRGPNASAIVVGLVALLFAGLIIARETLNWRVDWSRLGPGAIVGIGLVLVLIGAIGLIRRHDDA